MMCSTYDVDNRRHYTRKCTAVTETEGLSRPWGSIDIGAETYDAVCPYYDR